MYSYGTIDGAGRAATTEKFDFVRLLAGFCSQISVCAGRAVKMLGYLKVQEDENCKDGNDFGFGLGLMAWASKLANASGMGTAFTYQGRLTDAHSPADGLHDLRAP